VAGGGVDLLRLDSRASRLQRRLHGLFHDGVDLAVAFGRTADDGHAGDVAGKAVLATAYVDDDGVALLQLAAAGLVMREGAVAAGPHDPEGGSRTLLREAILDRRRELRLGHA